MARGTLGRRLFNSSEGSGWTVGEMEWDVGSGADIGVEGVALSGLGHVLVSHGEVW